MSLALGLSIVGVATSVLAFGYTLWSSVWRHPRLSLAFDARPVVTLCEPSWDPPGTEHWISLRVANQPGKRSAEQVEVLLVALRSDGELRYAGARALRWGGYPTAREGPFRDGLAFAGPQPVLTTTIPPGAFRHVELAGASDRGIVTDHQRRVLRLAVWPREPRFNLAAGRHELFLAVVAQDTDARYFRVVVDYDGTWSTEPGWPGHLSLALDERPLELRAVPGLDR